MHNETTDQKQEINSSRGKITHSVMRLILISPKQTILACDSNVMTVSMRLVLMVFVDMISLPLSCEMLAIITL